MRCGHRCRADPIEATTYSLEAEGEVREKFRANAAAELTVDVEESPEEGNEQKKYNMKVPVNISRDNVAEVRTLTE